MARDSFVDVAVTFNASLACYAIVSILSDVDTWRRFDVSARSIIGIPSEMKNIDFRLQDGSIDEIEGDRRLISYETRFVLDFPSSITYFQFRD